LRDLQLGKSHQLINGLERQGRRICEITGAALPFPWSMIRKSGNRFSEKIMLKQRDEIMMRFHLARIMI